MNQTKVSFQTRNIQILYDDTHNCTCNTSTNSMYRNEYCIPNYLLNDYANYNNFRSQPLYKDLQYINFFCQSLRDAKFCNYLANLCVLTNYNLDKNSPCSIFFSTQTAIITNGNGFFQNITPFLFYKRGKDTVDELDKVLDHVYKPYGSSEVHTPK